MTSRAALEQGVKLHQAGRLAEAEPLYAAALRAEPDSHAALHLMGTLRFHQRDFVQARGLLEQALRQRPQAVDTLQQYGATLAALGAPEEGLAALDRAIAVATDPPAQARGFCGRGDIFLGQQRAAEALAEFDKALAADPSLAQAWNNRGLALNALKRRDEGLASFDRALALAPGGVEIHSNRGDCLRELRRYEEALASFERALALAPRDWCTLTNRAVALSQMGRPDDALADYDKALAIQPHIPQALFARAGLRWSRQAALAPAIAELERLIQVAPDWQFARGSLMRLKMTAASWDDFDSQKALIDAGVRADKPVIEPLIYLALSGNSADLQHCARTQGRTRFAAQPPLAKKGARRPGRLRIGYLCGEFYNHAILHLMVGLFEAHDKSQFEVFAFDNHGGDGSPWRLRFETAVEHIIDITALSDTEAASRIAAEEIDILVDINGYSGNQRMGVLAYRPAPLQASFLGYPGTLGVSYLDYIIADRVVLPEADAACYDEKIAWLPHSYQINDDKRAIAVLPSRAQAGLPDRPDGAADPFVFCNFNRADKFTPASFALWMRILRQVPGSLLWLAQHHPLAMDNLRRQAARQGVDPARLLFAPMLPNAEHLARLALPDLFLDSGPYGAHTTASDALWAGLPLITRRGSAFAGRVAASLLSAVNMPELIAENDADFEALALRLARWPEVLAGIRKKLAANRNTAPLFDTVRNTRAIETAYRMMLEKPEPQNFAVP
jgi:predicted O-linked N-acetylglucosamine transferase (SPINDLY family)